MITGFKKVATRPLAKADSNVHIQIFAELFARGRNMFYVLPPLKKSQLTIRMMVPYTTKGKEFCSNFISFWSSFTHHSTSAGQV